MGSVSNVLKKQFAHFQSAASYTFHTSQFSTAVVFTYWLTKVQLF
jgi:hypothetical protein